MIYQNYKEEKNIKKCAWCKDYKICYNSSQRYNEEHYHEEITSPCEDYKEIG